MISKILYSIIAFFSLTLSVFAAPDIECWNLPWCDNTGNDVSVGVIGNLISVVIQYVAVIAVIAIMISGILYLVSGGDEEKVKKAKKWIIWSLVGVLLSVSAWFIINLINNLYIF